MSVEEQIHILHLVQTYRVPTYVVETAFRLMDTVANTPDPESRVLHSVDDFIRNESESSLEVILGNLSQTEFIESRTLNDLSAIIKLVDEKLHSIIDLDYKQKVTPEAIEVMKSNLRACDQLDAEGISNAIVTLACAVKDKKGFRPRLTQLVALAFLMLSHRESIGRLLEVMTGEGKSSIIAMFATVLVIQGKFVDIITSSPILADRDAEEWKSFFQVFDLTVADNTGINLEEAQKLDDQRKPCYKCNIVYGTISDFASDVLREEFQHMDVRCGRRFDTVIADEVDLLMLDEGV